MQVACQHARREINVNDMDHRENIEAAIRGAGLRITPVRVGVLEVLRRSPRPIDVPGILEKLPARTDAVTVYRTLNTFTRKQMVHRVRGEDRSWRYAMGEGAAERVADEVLAATPESRKQKAESR